MTGPVSDINQITNKIIMGIFEKFKLVLKKVHLLLHLDLKK